MKHKLASVIFVILCLLLLNGCSGTQLENMDILTTYFADTSDDKIKLGGGVANVRTLSDSMAEDPVSLIFATGETISEAEDKLIKSADHPLFFGGVRAVCISRDFAERGIGEFIESIKTDNKLRSESMFFVTETDAEKIVKHKAINDFTGGFAAESLLYALEEEGRIIHANLSDVFEMRSIKKVGIAVPTIDTKEDIMRFDGYAVFNKEKLIGFTDGEASDGVNIFLNKNAAYDFYINQKKYTVRKTKENKRAFFKDGKLHFDIEFEFECESDEISEKDIKEICGKLKSKAEAAFFKVKDTGCDFLKLYRLYQKDFRFEFENANYQEQIKNATSNIKVVIKK